jgi:hypothetical protein
LFHERHRLLAFSYQFRTIMSDDYKTPRPSGHSTSAAHSPAGFLQKAGRVSRQFLKQWLRYIIASLVQRDGAHQQQGIVGIQGLGRQGFAEDPHAGFPNTGRFFPARFQRGGSQQPTKEQFQGRAGAALLKQQAGGFQMSSGLARQGMLAGAFRLSGFQDRLGPGQGRGGAKSTQAELSTAVHQRDGNVTSEFLDSGIVGGAHFIKYHQQAACASRARFGLLPVLAENAQDAGVKQFLQPNDAPADCFFPPGAIFGVVRKI